MAKYRISKKAIKDLSNIWNYTYDEWSETQANIYYKQIRATFEEIVIEPNIGRNYAEVDKQFFGCKSGQHIVFYRKNETSSIEIVRVLHGMMNIPEKMQE